MAEELSIVTKPRDYSDIVQLLDPDVLGKSSFSYIAELITGYLAVGNAGMFVASGRLVQAVLKGKLFQQWGNEFKKLRDAGKIPDDFGEKRYGPKTWEELMRIIDEETPDADRLDALKAMFYEVNKANVSDATRIAAYHLWQIVKSLSSGELLLLKTAFEQRDTYKSSLPSPGYDSYDYWANCMAQSIGHNMAGLIGVHEKKLTELGLLSQRSENQRGTSPVNARLTDLGIKVCENIKNYQLVLHEIESD